RDRNVTGVQTCALPILADSILDVIPVDHVVNVIVALATQDVSRRGDDAYYQVVSGNSNLLPFHEMVTAVREYFTEHPLEDDRGQIGRASCRARGLGRKV